MLEEDPLLVFEYDAWEQSGLIIACKRDYTDMAVLLMKSYARVNWTDIIGRTALMYAVQNNNADIVRFLLCFRASPYFCVGQGDGAAAAGKNATEICSDPDMVLQLRKAMWLRLGQYFYHSTAELNVFWEYEALRYFDPNNDLKMPANFKFC